MKIYDMDEMGTQLEIQFLCVCVLSHSVVSDSL